MTVQPFELLYAGGTHQPVRSDIIDTLNFWLGPDRLVLAAKAAAATMVLTAHDAVTVLRWETGTALAPALYKKVASNPGHAFSFQDQAGNWFEIAEDEISIGMAGGPVALGNDASPALQRAIDFVRAQFFLNNGAAFAKRITGSGRVWTLNTSINIVNLRQVGLFLCDAAFHGKMNNRVMFDLQGSQGVTLSNIHFWGDRDTQPLGAIWIGRARFPLGSGGFGVAGDHRFINVRTDGYFKGFALLNYGSEVNIFTNCQWGNRTKIATRPAVMITGHDSYITKHIGAIISDFITGGDRLTGPTSCIDHGLGWLNLRRPSPWSAAPIVSISQSATGGIVTLAAAVADNAVSLPPQSGDRVSLHDAAGMVQLDALTSLYVERLTDTTFRLHSNAALTAPVDTSGFTTFTSGNLWGGSGPCLILSGGVSDVTGDGGYLSCYAADAVLFDSEYDNSGISNVHLNFQVESAPLRVVRGVAPASGEVTYAKNSIVIHGRNQTPLQALLVGQQVGPGWINWANSEFDLSEMPAAAFSADWVFVKSTFKMTNVTLRLPKLAAFAGDTGFADGTTFKGRVYFNDANGTFLDFSNSVKTLATDANATLVAGETSIFHTGTLTAGRVLTLPTTGGDIIRVARSGAGAFNLVVRNGDVGLTLVRNLTTGQWLQAKWDAGAQLWKLMAAGTL